MVMKFQWPEEFPAKRYVFPVFHVFRILLNIGTAGIRCISSHPLLTDGLRSLQAKGMVSWHMSKRNNLQLKGSCLGTLFPYMKEF